MSERMIKLESGLSEMETPLLEARSLAMAVRMMAAANELPKDASDALDAVADTIFEKLIGLCEDRTRLWRLAREETKLASTADRGEG
jgi:hypothetical protein